MTIHEGNNIGWVGDLLSKSPTLPHSLSHAKPNVIPNEVRDLLRTKTELVILIAKKKGTSPFSGSLVTKE
jgi:hypothetical protein